LKSILSMHLCWFLILKKNRRVWYDTIRYQKKIVTKPYDTRGDCYDIVRYQNRLIWNHMIPGADYYDTIRYQKRWICYHTIPREIDRIRYQTRLLWHHTKPLREQIFIPTIPEEIVMIPYDISIPEDCYRTIRYKKETVMVLCDAEEIVMAPYANRTYDAIFSK